jgi:branched-chain amino acid aminotransferase
MLGTAPLRVLTSSVARKAPRSLGAHVKSLNYLDAIVAKQQAKAAGLDDAIMLDVEGAVAECSSTNIFAVLEGRLCTPTTRAALPGITRRTVLELAGELGVPTEEREIWPMELLAADAAFVTGSGAGIVAIGEIDGRPLETASDSIFVRLRDAYRKATSDPRFVVPLAVRAG